MERSRKLPSGGYGGGPLIVSLAPPWDDNLRRCLLSARQPHLCVLQGVSLANLDGVVMALMGVCPCVRHRGDTAAFEVDWACAGLARELGVGRLSDQGKLSHWRWRFFSSQSTQDWTNRNPASGGVPPEISAPKTLADPQLRTISAAKHHADARQTRPPSYPGCRPPVALPLGIACLNPQPFFTT